MSIPTMGLITIASLSPSGSTVQLDTDPATYRSQWPRRQSIHEGIDSVTKQDWGRRAKDRTIRLESGPKQWLNKSTVDALDEFAGRKGATFTFKDGEGTEATVTIESFDPDQAEGMKDLYVYTMSLHVFAIAKLRGQTYTGD